MLDTARLTAAWRVFRWAAGENAGGWDMAAKDPQPARRGRS